MSTDEEKLQRKLDAIRTTNAGLANDVEELGGQVDVATARVEHFTEWMVENGLMTPLQRLEEQMKWEQGLKPQLVRVRDGLREVYQQRRPQVNTRPAQLPPDGPKLIIPGS